MPWTQKSNQSKRRMHRGQHRFEHWYRDNQVYFITAKTSGGEPVFIDELTTKIFWTAFAHYTQQHTFVPWVTSLMNNHYHTLGYLRVGSELPKMMRGLHGRVAKQINDLREAGHFNSSHNTAEAGGLKSTRPKPQAKLKPFWGDKGKKTYFDGCIRDEKQATLAFYYTRDQAVRAGLVERWQDYPDTRVDVELDRALARARELDAFLRGVRYKRYMGDRGD